MYPIPRRPRPSDQIISRPISEWRRLAQLGLLNPDRPLYNPVSATWRRAWEHPQLRPFFPIPPKPIDWPALIRIGAFITLAYGIHKAATNAGLQDLSWNELRRAIFRRDEYTCTYCGHRGNARTLHVDHAIPRSRGGNDDPSNLTTACWQCNLQKGAKTRWEYGI